MLRRLCTAVMPVADLAKARDWYAELLGFAPYFDEPFYVGFEVGGYELGLLPDGGPASVDGAAPLWGVDDLDAAWARVLALGATALEAPHGVGGDIRVAAVTDPFGNRLGLIENPGFAVPAKGSVTVAEPPKQIVAGPISARAIVIEQRFKLPRAALWAAWASAEALQAWMTDEVRMELRIGGPFEVLFMPPGTPERGSEGCKVLGFVPERMLSFTWNAPPHLAHARGRHTWVVLDFADAPGGGATLRLTHSGWPEAGLAEGGHPDWPAAFAYFEQAWPRVFDGLRAHLEAGA